MPQATKPHLENLRKYSPGKPIEELRRELGVDRISKLASNENPIGPSPLALAAVRACLDDVHRYPDAAQYEVKSAICDVFGAAPENVVVGNGSDELIHYLGVAFLSPGDDVVVGSPSFIQYTAAAILNQADIKSVPLDPSERMDLEAMAAACSDRTRLVWVANPNNPTGTIVMREEFERFLDSVPRTATVVLDEAYFDFARDEAMPDSLELVKAGRNIIGLRTLSKSYGLAGLRIGFAFLPPETADVIERMREPFNVNLLAQRAAAAALYDREHLENTLHHNRKSLERISRAVSSCGGKPTKSFANFVWAEFPFDTKPLFDALLRQGVIVRTGDIFGRPTCLRISAGTDDEMEHFEASLPKAVEMLNP